MRAPMKTVCSFAIAVAALFFCSTTARAQASDLTLNQMDQAHLDALAALTAKKIREAKPSGGPPKVLVFDFFRGSPGTSSQLGTLLADRFSELLSGYATGMKILDRKILKDYLTENWTTLEDLRSNEVCFRLAGQLGASGAILGTLAEKDDKIDPMLHLEGFGPKEKEDDIFAWRDRTVSFSLTEELHAALFQSGPNYSRKSEDIPEEPGVFRHGEPGVTAPQCEYCPDPEFSDAARAVKFQGKVVLSVVVNVDGHVSGIFVLKGAPFGLTTQSINATKNWRFKPGQKDGRPVPVRLDVETTFSLL